MKTINENNISKKDSLEYEKAIKDDESNWESGDYGKNENYMVRATPLEEKRISKMIGKKEKQKTYSIKMPDDLVKKLKSLAAEKNIGYQTLLKIIASDYINKHYQKAS